MSYYQYANPRTLSISPRNRYTSLPVKPAKPMGNLIEGANVRVTTGNSTADTILKWGFWIGIGLATYRLYRVVRYDDPFIQPSYRLPPAWEANPRKVGEEKRARALELYEPGKPVGPVAKAVGVSPVTIINWTKEAGIYESAREGPRDEAAFKRVLELYKPGETVGPIVKAVGVSKNTIIRWMKEAGIYEAAREGPRDTAAFKRALELYEPGKPVGPVAEAVGVSLVTIINWMEKAGRYEAAPMGGRGFGQKDLGEKMTLAFELYEPGKPVGPVAEAVGVSINTIIRWMEKAGRYKAAPSWSGFRQKDLDGKMTLAFALYKPGEPVGPVAKAVGVSSTTIINWMKKDGRYKAAPSGIGLGQKDLDEKRELAFELYKPGEPVGPVAEAVGVSLVTIIKWMKEAGIYETAKEGPRDEAAFKRALELYEPGEPVGPVAEAVGVSTATIINWMKKAGIYEAAPVGGRGSRKKPSKNPWFVNGLRFF